MGDRFTRREALALLGGAIPSMMVHKVEATPTLEPVRIGWVEAMANAPVLIARHEGYFDRQGLSVTLAGFPSGLLIREGLLDETLDMAYIGVPPIVHWVAGGAPLVIVAKVNYGQAVLVARRRVGIRKVTDLRGRRLAGVRRGSGMDVLLRGCVLAEHGGLTVEDLGGLEAMAVTDMGSALEAGEVDAAFMWEPYVTQLLARRTVRVVLNVNRVEPHYPWYVIAVRRAFMERHPGRVEGVLRAHRSAITRLWESPNSGNATIAEAFALSAELGPDGKTYTAEEVVKRARSRLGWEWELDGGDESFIRRLMGWSTRLGLIEQAPALEELVDMGPMRRIRGEYT